MRNTYTKTVIVVQGSLQTGYEYSETLNQVLDKIKKVYPRLERSPVLLPTSSSNGRLTTLIQFSYYKTESRITTDMVKELVDDIYSKIDFRGGIIVRKAIAKNKAMMLKKIQSFIK